MGVLLATALLGCARADKPVELTAGQRDAIRADVEQVLRQAYDLSKPGVADRMLALYAKSGRVVSAHSGRASTSRDSLESGIRYFWDNVGTNMRDAKWEWGPFHVDVLAPDAAAVTATYTIPHRNPHNQPRVLGGAMTVVLVRRNGRWAVVQEHLSDLPQR